MVPFAGWEMPVSYSSIIDEHRAVREACGMFDISHMGEFFVRGPGAQAWLESLLTNRVEKLQPGVGQYTFLLNENGGVIDDLIIYRIGAEDYLLVVNAAKIEEDAAWMEGRRVDGVEFENASEAWAAIAVQGPQAPGIHEKIFGVPNPERNHLILLESWGGYSAGTGYTGEAGFEVFVPAAKAEELWDALMAAGVKPCGLGARDTLRLEMGYPLNGSDLDPGHSPLEAGMGIFVDLSKDFTGVEKLRLQKADGPGQKLCGLKLEKGAPPPRPGYAVYRDAEGGEAVGRLTSGALSPSLGFGIAMTYLPVEISKPGQVLQIEVRGKRYPATVCRKPFYTPSATA